MGRARSSACPLIGSDHAVLEQFATPDTPRLATLQRPGQAGGPHRAAAAQALCPPYVLRLLGKEQFRVALAGQCHSAGVLRPHARAAPSGLQCGPAASARSCKIRHKSRSSASGRRPTSGEGIGLRPGRRKAPRLGIDAQPGGLAGRGRPGRDAELGQEGGDVVVHRPLGDEQTAGDLQVGQALGEQRQNLLLACRQPRRSGPRGRAGPPRDRLHPESLILRRAAAAVARAPRPSRAARACLSPASSAERSQHRASGRVPGSAPATSNTTRSPSPSRSRPR